ncbi:hypothetical protein C0J52_01417 [Blattella germanica]|nr:hypothetical protein C0J52_01417 [Blattella germanica]
MKLTEQASTMKFATILLLFAATVFAEDKVLFILNYPKVHFLNKISTVRLPSRSQVSETFEDVTSTVSGWGRDSDDSSSITPILRWVENPVIQNFVCNVLFFGSITDGHICTSGTGGKGTCNGDSGGPLTVLESDGQITQVGIVSFGISFGCEIGWPLAFARVTYYLDWIAATTGIPIRN